MIQRYGLYAIALSILISCSAPEEKVGVVGFGPEAMYFRDCSSGERSWLHEDSWDAEGWTLVTEEVQAQPRCDLRSMPCRHQLAYVVAEISLSKPGSYGHLGKYKTEAKVHNVREVHAFNSQCEL